MYRINVFGHIFMTLITGGLWVPILLIRMIFGGSFFIVGLKLLGHLILTLLTGGLWLVWLFAKFVIM